MTEQEHQGGHMFRLEHDEHGLPRAVPSDETYMDMTAAGGDDSPRIPARETYRGWWLARQTDPDEDGAPSWADLTPAERTLWLEHWQQLDTETVASAFAGLSAWVVKTFPGSHVWRSPGRTGQSLLLRTLPWGGKGQPAHRYCQLDPVLGRLIAATSPLQRIETLTRPGQVMSSYRYYDARMAHVSGLRYLPLVGETGVIHDHESEYEPYRDGRYLVDLTVPAGWAHIGLAPYRNTSVPGGWEWPSTPGASWETWLDERELRLLDDPGNGMDPWPYAIRERILFARENEAPQPARELLSRLAPALEQLDRAERTPANRIKRALLRAIPLGMIGDWMKMGNADSREIDDLEELTPEDATATILPRSGGGYTVSGSAPISSYQEHWRHPEWSHAIYAHERYAVTRRALTVPRESVLAIRGDALHLADVTPSGKLWDDKGKLGNYRQKASQDFPAPVVVPAQPWKIAGMDQTEQGAE